MIDRNQANLTGMLRAVFGHNADQTEVLEAVPALATLNTQLGENIASLDLIAADADESEGVTKNKDTARKKAIFYAVPIAAAVKAEANTAGDAELLQKVDYSKSDLEGLREENYLPIIEKIATEAGKLTAKIAKRGITAEHLADLTAWNAKFRKLVSAPKTVMSDITKQDAKYEALQKKTMEMVRDEMDPTALAASLTFPDFYVGYEAARVIIDRPAGFGDADLPTPPTP